MKKITKKKASSIEMSIPETFNGEIIATQTGGGVVDPLTQVFGNGDLNTLKDKINEIIGQL